MIFSTCIKTSIIKRRVLKIVMKPGKLIQLIAWISIIFGSYLGITSLKEWVTTPSLGLLDIIIFLFVAPLLLASIALVVAGIYLFRLKRWSIILITIASIFLLCFFGIDPHNYKLFVLVSVLVIIALVYLWSQYRKFPKSPAAQMNEHSI